jgi:osomolarity two-component system response regulator SKN7
MTHSYETAKSGGAGGPGSGASGSANDAPAGTGGGQQPCPSEFIKKLFKMLEDESATYGRGKPVGAPRSKGERGSVGWGRGGSSFVVWDMNEFTTKVLPQTFRHSNFSSFVRQLNKYGFSKIKHVDEETGQIKENVWEFQHPNFQAGGKADLDSIKRKAVVPKKAPGDERSDSPARGLTAEDANRMMEMESRMVALEEALFKSQEQLRDARIRENGVMSIVRELVAHVVTTDKENPSAPDSDANARVRRIYQVYEQVAQSYTLPSHAGAAFVPGAPPVAGYPPAVYGTSAPNPYGAATLPFPGVEGGRLPVPVQNRRVVPNGRGTATGLAPVSSTSPSSRSQPSPQAMTSTPQLPDDSKMPQQSQLYNGSPLNPAYPTMQDGSAANGVPIRKPGESTSLSFVVDGMGGQSSQLNATGASMDEQQQQQQQQRQQQQSDLNASASMSTTDGDASGRPSSAYNSMAMQQPQPQQASTSRISANGQPEGPGAVARRTPIKPSWTQTPRILVVEDDLVYRQLSSKFLEKFGCVVETVENAQQGIEKMNKTKYDLVLMDIFFGPSMDGRKATSLIRQFDTYTPIISMTSNVQTSECAPSGKADNTRGR